MGTDFIGEINPSSSGQHRWILIATDYFTKWIEAIPRRQATETVIMQFLEEHILSRFRVPKKIITNNPPAFKSKKMVEFCSKYHIQLGNSTAYYPQGNGLVESSNKNLMRIIKKLLQDNKKAWHTNLIHAYERIEIVAFKGKNAYVLDEMEGGLVFGAPVNGRLLKHYFL